MKFMLIYYVISIRKLRTLSIKEERRGEVEDKSQMPTLYLLCIILCIVIQAIFNGGRIKIGVRLV